MIVKGLDLTKVRAAEHAAAATLGARTLILDGDGPAYRAAATVKRLDTAIRHFQGYILAELDMTRCGTATVHLTHRRCAKNGRTLVRAAKPYQGQRKGKAKPPLLEPLREAMLDKANWLPEFEVRMHFDIEADDAMIIQAHQLRESGVIWSDDKDLRCTPYHYYEQSLGIVQGFEPHGYIEEKFTPAGNLKVVGRGPVFFWAQMLMGDSADNIAGLLRYQGKLCGPAGALQVLRGVRNRDEAANLVLEGYREIRQNALAEGHLLHLLQHPRDTVQDYFLSHDLTPLNREFVLECAAEQWMDTPEDVQDKLPWED